MEDDQATLFAFEAAKLIAMLMFLVSIALYVGVSFYYRALWWNPQAWWSYCISSLNFFGLFAFFGWIHLGKKIWQIRKKIKW